MSDMPWRYQLKDKVRSYKKMLVAVWFSQSSKAPGQEDAGEGPGGVRVFPVGLLCLVSPRGSHLQPRDSWGGGCRLRSIIRFTSSNWRLITQQVWLEIPAIYFYICRDQKGANIYFPLRFMYWAAALEGVSLPSALLQFNFACKAKPTPGGFLKI